MSLKSFPSGSGLRFEYSTGKKLGGTGKSWEGGWPGAGAFHVCCEPQIGDIFSDAQVGDNLRELGRRPSQIWKAPTIVVVSGICNPGGIIFGCSYLLESFLCRFTPLGLFAGFDGRYRRLAVRPAFRLPSIGSVFLCLCRWHHGPI
jgi:hypothetical protein